jgi:hypothetical protein
MSEIAFAPALPFWAIGLIGAVAASVALLSIIRTPRSGALRLVALAALMGLLLNPQFRFADRTKLDEIAVVLVDRSASQSLDGRDKATAIAAEKLNAQLDALGGVETVRVDVGGLEETRLGEALRAAIGDNPRSRLGAVFLITDGRSTDAIPVESLAPEIPVHALITGRPDEIDRKITLVNAPRYGVVNEGVDVGFRIDDLGPDNVKLENRGGADVRLAVDGEEVLRQEVPVGVEVSFRAPLSRPGGSVVELSVAAAEGELTSRNNSVVLPIAAIRDRLRVLLISGEPHAGERVWRNLLKSDPAIDLVHFTILRPIEKAQNDNALENELALIEFPQDELFIEKLAEFDLVIFDRYTHRGVLNAYHFDNLGRYVENGGAVLISSGPEFGGYLSLATQRNFAHVLPALPSGPEIETPFRPALSNEGKRHPVTADLPERDYWGRWLRLTPAAPRSGMVLMTGPGAAPLLILDRVGEGRVGMIQSDHVWLWARGFDGGGPHAELLRRIAHWLMKEPDLEEERLILSDDRGALVIERRTIGEASGPVSLTLPDGAERELRLIKESEGIFRARLENAPRGLYRARDGGLFAIGSVGVAAPPEFDNVVSDRSQLSPVAAFSKGGVFDLRRGGEVATPEIRRIAGRSAQRAGSGWAGIVERDAYRTEDVRDAPALAPLAWLLILGTALLGAWLVEGRGGRLGRHRRGAKIEPAP